jgi:hypothetical protein
MAILDNLGREIKEGDLIVFTNGEVNAFQVVGLKEPSLLGADLKQVPVGELTVACQFSKALANPGRQPHLLLQDVLIVHKNVPDDTTAADAKVQ